MRKILLVFLLQSFWMAGFSQSLPFKSDRPFMQHPNLLISWEALTNPWPKTIWVYQSVPTVFSPAVISNLLVVGHFTEKDFAKKDINNRVINTNICVHFYNSGRVLQIVFGTGQIEYWIPEPNLLSSVFHDVPETNQLYRLATNFLPKLGIHVSELTKTESGEPKILIYNEKGGTYFQNGKEITKTYAREVHFIRTVDGIEYQIGGEGQIDFGENDQVVGLSLVWRSLKPDKSYTAATPEMIMQWIRDGKAIIGGMHDTESWFHIIPVDWHTAKSLTIKKAEPYYWSEHSTGVVYPVARLLATVDTGTNQLNVGILCPIIDDTKP